MSANLGSVVVAIKAVDEASGVMGKIQASMGILGGTLQSLGGGFAGLGNVVQGFAAAGVAGAAITAVGEITKGIQWSVEEAKQSEQAFKNLSTAVERSGTAWGDVETKTRDYLAQLQNTTVYSDEALAGMVEWLLTFGMTYDQAMTAAGTALDLAAAKHMDLESAAGLMGKAFMGNTAILQRYGIDITTSKEATAAFKAAVDTVGDALSTAKAGGQLDGFKDSIGDMGVAVNDSEGKMRSFKDIATDLVSALAEGRIDTAEYGQTLADLGIDVGSLNLTAADFSAVMTELNEQFGGAAQAQAQTYAGIQERLKNATSELGEKIGGMVLPALAGMTEAMIPVVDWFGKGLDSIQAWLSEVGKMPEVKGAMDSLGVAFEGFKGYLESVWKVIVDAFGPALQELWQAFKDIWDALQPAIDAFKEIFGALSSGGEDVDVFKLLIQYLAAEIRVIADVIKFVAPYIKQFAEAFKAAAEFISPILAQMSKDIGAFIAWLKDAFQGFYTWLVGGSLWMDMWNSLLSVASTMIGALLGDFGSKFFEPMKDAFTGAMQWVEDSWNKGWDAVQTGFTTYVDNFIPNLTAWGDFLETNVTSFTDSVKSTWDTSWQAVQTTFDTITSQIQTGLNTRFDEMKLFVTQNLGEYAPIANDALSAMQAASNAVMALIRGDWGGFLDGMNNALYLFWGAIQGMTSAAFAQLDSSFRGSMDALKGILDFAIGAMQGAWTTFTSFISQGIEGFKSAISDAQSWLQSTFSSMQATAASAMASIQSTVMAAVNAIVAAAQSLWAQLVGGSIWTDMLAEMQAQTASALGNIVGDFQGAFSDVALSVPTLPCQAGPSRGSEVSAPLISQPPQSITVPVQVQIDGATVARTVERRLIANRQLTAWRSG